MRIPTVTIKADNAKGRKIINESDYDPAKHQLYGDSASEPIDADPDTSQTTDPAEFPDPETLVKDAIDESGLNDQAELSEAVSDETSEPTINSAETDTTEIDSDPMPETKAELVALADEYGIKVLARDTIADLKDKIATARSDAAVQ